jgi:hypothetical protein
MNPEIEKKVDQFAEAVTDIHDEIELVSQEGASLEDIERAKTLAADLIHKYGSLLNQLGPDDKLEVQRRMGLVVEQIKGKLVKLKEAPE